MFIDSHCHLNMLDLAPFDGSLQKVISEAKDMGVTHFLNVSVTEKDYEPLLKIALEYDNIYISVGLHPNENPGESLDLELLTKNAQHEKVIAIGETGLDYYRSEGDLSWQHERFIQQIELSKQTQKPLIIHTRQAKEDTIKIMREHNAQDARGVMHCFTEDWAMAKKAIDLGFYISFSGIVTFKNAKDLQDVAQKCPLDRMLIETDSPYLAPVPHRGKPNYPGYVSLVAKFIAQLRGESVDTIAKKTSQNFFTLFSPNA
jgi:TatD DNase family protein